MSWAGLFRIKQLAYQKPVTEKVEVPIELGPDDILVLQCQERLTREKVEMFKKYLSEVINKEGRHVLVLDSGLQYSIIKRKGALDVKTLVKPMEMEP